MNFEPMFNLQLHNVERTDCAVPCSHHTDLTNALTCKSMANLSPASSEDVAVKENGEAGGGEAASSGGAKRPILLPPTTTAVPMLAPSKTSPRERSPSPTSKQNPPPPPTNSKPAAKQSPPPPPPINSKPQSENRFDPYYLLWYIIVLHCVPWFSKLSDHSPRARA